jgi:hypothetical protein
MDLDRSYAKQVRHHLGFFPVWPPGDEVKPGDVGRLDYGLLHRGGIFHREGTLAETMGIVDIQVTQRPMTGVTRFRSSDCSSTGVKVSGGAPAAAGVTSTAQMTLTFASAGGVAFDATDCTEQTITNVLGLCERIQSDRARWPDKFVLVTRVTLAQNFLVVISGEAGASVDLSGNASALGSWNLAGANFSLTEGNSSGYQRAGAGPILIGVYGFGWFVGPMHPLSLTPPVPEHTEEGFIEFAARNAAFD